MNGTEVDVVAQDLKGLNIEEHQGTKVGISSCIVQNDLSVIPL